MEIAPSFSIYLVNPQTPMVPQEDRMLVRAGIATPGEAIAWMKHYNKVLSFAYAHSLVEVRHNPGNTRMSEMDLEAMISKQLTGA